MISSESAGMFGREGEARGKILGQKCVDSSTAPRFQTIGRHRGWPRRKREGMKTEVDTRVRNARRERQSERDTRYYAGGRGRGTGRDKRGTKLYRTEQQGLS